MNIASLKNYPTIILVFVLILALAFPAAYFFWPAQPANAAFSDCIAAFFVGLFQAEAIGVVGIPTNPSDSSNNSGDSWQNFIHNCLEHTVALAIGQIILNEMTNEIVTWIDSGFQGRPAFVTNPGRFFQNIGNEVAGGIIGGIAPFLCSPFSLQEQLALALDVNLSLNANVGLSGGSPNLYASESCTLQSIIGGSTDAINNFTNDFSQGGWPAYFSLSVNDQDSPYGSFLEADSDIQASVDSEQGLASVQVDWGQGFLSSQTCTDEDDNTVPSFDELDDSNDPDGTIAAEYNDGEVSCDIQTPGTTISSVLDKQLGIPADQLGVADDLDKIFDALGSELVTTALNQGLEGLTHSNSPDGGNALENQINNLSYENAASTTETGDEEEGEASATSTINSNVPVITLNGANPMYVEVGQGWSDPGAEAVEYAGGPDAPNNPILAVDPPDTTQTGTYYVNYTFTNNQNYSATVQRTVKVVDPPTITLLGANPDNYPVNTPWSEPSPAYSATGYDPTLGYNAADISSDVQEVGTNSINTGDEVGDTFGITYSVTDPVTGISTSTTRTVIIVGLEP